jgi:hypothetical protein
MCVIMGMSHYQIFVCSKYSFEQLELRPLMALNGNQVSAGKRLESHD